MYILIESNILQWTFTEYKLLCY